MRTLGRPSRPLIHPVAASILWLLTAGGVAAQQIMPVPQVDWGWEMLEVRELLQRQTVDQFEVYYDFRFTDRQPQSGIDFEHHTTPDSGKFYQPNHYDHGNGITVADIDGDGRYDIYLVSQLGSNGLYRNLGGGRFENVTEAAGVGLADRLGATASFGDIDNDGDPDLFVTTVRQGNALFENDGSGHFTDITAAAGVAYTGHSSGAVFFDYDGDGLLDLFLANVGTYTTGQMTTEGYWAGIVPDGKGGDAFNGHLMPERTEYSILYKNLGDRRFRDVSSETGLRDGSWSGDAAITDVNGDGRPDLYVCNMQGDDHFYQNVDGASFRDRTAELFPKTPWGTMGVKFFDFDNDGRSDLLLTDMHSDMSRKVTPGYEKFKSFMAWSDETLQGGANNLFGNALYLDKGGEPWLERSDELGAENYWPWGVSVGDLNADGWLDVLITSSMNFPYSYGVNSLLLNNKGKKLLDSEFLVGIEPRSILPSRPWYDAQQPWLATKRPWFLLECAGADSRHPLCRGRRDSIQVLGNVGTRSAVIFDLDGDGDLDIVTNEFHDHPQVLISDLAERRPLHWIQVELTGTRSNRDGLGATVEVHAGGHVYTRYHDGSSGYLSHSLLPLYFGLGEATAVDRIVVHWPAGGVQTVKRGLELGSTVEITEP